MHHTTITTCERLHALERHKKAKSPLRSIPRTLFAIAAFNLSTLACAAAAATRSCASRFSLLVMANSIFLRSFTIETHCLCVACYMKHRATFSTGQECRRRNAEYAQGQKGLPLRSPCLLLEPVPAYKTREHRRVGQGLGLPWPLSSRPRQNNVAIQCRGSDQSHPLGTDRRPRRPQRTFMFPG